jgi:phospholipid/cholesterol/gamma-HCH transport system substrate-binding protein
MTGSLQRGVAAACALLLLVALGWTILKPVGQYRVTAYFTRSIGLYSGSSVRILGIPVGTIDSVVPQGDRVKVTMSLDDTYKVPADAKAVILAPSLVSDRYVQFAPVYNGGATMKDGAVVGLDRTAVPVELDQVYDALDTLGTALGPNGANKNGALTDLVNTGAANLKGNGEQLNQTLAGFSQAIRTLSDNRDGLFDSLDNLQTFTTALASVDTQVGQFNSNLAAVAQQLAGERQDLATAIQLLTRALGDVATFVRNNTTLLQTNVDKLADVTLTLVQQRQALAEVMDTAPAALENLSHAYNPDTGTLDTRDNSSAFLSPEVLVCQVLASAGKLQIGGINIGDPTALLGLPPTDAICARLLSGDANNDGKLDDLNSNGIPDLQELEGSLFGGGGGTSPGGGSGSLPGLPSVGSSR